MINFKNKNNDNQNISKCENSATNIYLIKPHESKCLFDEVNDYLKIMKKGEHFSKIINSKGSTTTYLLKLSQDETIISLLLNRICIYETEIYVENITNCEIGHSNNFYSSKKFENFFTIELNDNQFYEFYHQSQETIKSWVNCINYLLQKKKGNQISTSLKRLSKEDISDIWQQEIIPNWTIYRKYIHDKNKQNYFTKKVETNKKRLCIYSSLEENIIILKSNNQEILNLWGLGLPTWLRKNLWNIIIGNELEISEKLFNGYAKGIFNEFVNNQQVKLKHITNINNSNRSFNEEDLNKSNDKENLINDLNYDINTFYNKFETIIKSEKKSNFKKDIYLIVRCFCNYRQDVLYTKEITELASFIYLNSDNNYDTFRIFCNIVIPSYLFDFIQNNISNLKNYYYFFEKLMQKYTPLLYNYITTLNFSLFNIFYRWTKNLFLKVFPYDINLIIFDNFIIRGKIFIFQVTLAILIINQKELIKFDINKLNQYLKKSEFNIDEYTLFETINKLDIRKEYEDFFDIYELGKEKIELFQDM